MTSSSISASGRSRSGGSAAAAESTGAAGARTPAGSQGTEVATAQGGSELTTSRGRTSIADSVVAKIAGIATREISGVYNLGGGATRAFGALKERIPGSSGPSVTQGVSVEVGERQTAIDIDVVVEYGVAVADLAQAIRRNVISSVERMTGLEVTEVNVSVDDIHLPDDDSGSDTGESRVQ